VTKELPYLLRAKDVEALPRSEAKHFLNERAIRRTRSLGDLTGLTGLGIHLVEVPVGQASTEFHTHHYEDEFVYILSGTAEAMVGDECFSVGPGDFIGYRKGGLAHALKNTGETVLKYLAGGERKANDVVDYPVEQIRFYRNEGLSKDAVRAEHIQGPSNIKSSS
tara:strand:+ start:500 stop:994 length:495 start_codon:yes stop_codon:yes gene_type:complete